MIRIPVGGGAVQHIATTNPDGTIHVQNIVHGLLGQHHVHTPENFAAWQAMVAEKYGDKVADPLPQTVTCSCGLAPGTTREYDGDVHPGWTPEDTT